MMATIHHNIAKQIKNMLKIRTILDKETTCIKLWNNDSFLLLFSTNGQRVETYYPGLNDIQTRETNSLPNLEKYHQRS